MGQITLFTITHNLATLTLPKKELLLIRIWTYLCSYCVIVVTDIPAVVSSSCGLAIPGSKPRGSNQTEQKPLDCASQPLIKLNKIALLDASILKADTCASLLRLLFSPANYFINEIYNLFPCNIASYLTLGTLGEHSNTVGKTLGCASCFPTLLVLTKRVFRWGYITRKRVKLVDGDKLARSSSGVEWPTFFYGSCVSVSQILYPIHTNA